MLWYRQGWLSPASPMSPSQHSFSAGQMGSCTRCSGTSFSPSPCTRVSAATCAGTDPQVLRVPWLLSAHLAVPLASGGPCGMMLRLGGVPGQFLPAAMLSLQALCSSCSITTRAGACTGCERWERGTTWT